MHLFPAGAGQVVSIHAPAWGATNAFAFRAYNYIVFQSTHPRGVRLPVMRRRFQPHHVSIHAPAWGATGRLGIRSWM